MGAIIQAIVNVPALVKILVSLAVILAANRLKAGLPVSVFIGTVVLAVWCRHPAASIAAITFERAVSIDNLFLMAVILLVIWLSSVMAETGTMQDLVTAVRSRTNRRAAMAILPAIIGLLPMPGGALFSAPMVADCDKDGLLPPTMKTSINYWFRHIWEYSWPLYPGVLLAVDLAGVKVWVLPVMQFPLTLLSLGVGYLFLLRHIPQGENIEGTPVGGILRLMQPIIIVIAVFVIISVAIPSAAEFNKYLPMAIGLVASLIVVQVSRPLDWAAWRRILFSKRAYGLVLLVTLVRIYGAFIEAPLPNGILLIDQVREELAAAGVPETLLVMFLPFICGLTTGITVGFVGASFPIVMSLIEVSSGSLTSIAPVILAYASGFMGVMVSPVHVCFVVSAEHFDTGLPENLTRLAAPVASIILGAFGYYTLLNLL